MNQASDQSGSFSVDQQQLTFGEIDRKLDESIQNISEGPELVNNQTNDSHTNRSVEGDTIFEELDKSQKKVKFKLDSSEQNTNSDLSYLL